ncbi:MSMEG_0567/Sll0786 family nitrogen starvation N-acetyltransferase [Azospirillum rugosum]|uniref:N-acetyltransferase (TIGR04045 family) n=1 Tax=Azospirillum rugosum TaxID=416170 RepID=A0ABS4SMD9_9PROT|nr:MSMEG_0567/Sll0786 family nitrogen starvation N-acetyltransferase [Azospirillum rugosum]MBP2293729.1 putative N-acetyltransferase (TIGR04045 family) [Azospirillum rugosum]MDQ0527274.1 putative N-acetyltransferase (TIGR04045 family) [Azospirillum rugosum]
MVESPPFPFVTSAYRIKHATEAWEQAGAAALRRLVFCTEQGLFQGSDRDAIDDVATTIVALSDLCGMPDAVVGTVRIHQPQPGFWIGSRLAVAEEHRRAGTLGPALIRMAVCTATAMGCLRFSAHVQSQNALLFRRMRWKTVEEVLLHGMPHHHMQADLAHYPPIHDGSLGFMALPRRAA